MARTAHAAADHSQGMPTQSGQRRRAGRFPVRLVVDVSIFAGATYRSSLVDLSEHGCSLQSDSPPVKAGQFVTVNLSPSQQSAAIVRWVRGDLAGVEFLHPISSETVEKFAPPDDRGTKY